MECIFTDFKWKVYPSLLSISKLLQNDNNEKYSALKQIQR